MTQPPTNQQPTYQTNNSNLPVFDPSRGCVACGSCDVDAKFQEKVVIGHKKPESIGPVIERRCRNCGYLWYELPLYLAKGQVVEKSSFHKTFEWIKKYSAGYAGRGCWLAVFDGKLVGSSLVLSNLQLALDLDDSDNQAVIIKIP